MKANTFAVLGSSSGMPNPRCACSGYVLQVGQSLNLIDCGGGVASSFLRCGFDPLSLDRIFISHTHSDHVAELGLFIQMLHGLDSDRRLTLYLPDEFVRPFETYMPAVYLIKERLRLDLDIRGYAEGVILDGLFRMTAVRNSHHAGLAPLIKKLNLPLKMQSYSFKMEVAGKSLFYSADIGCFEDIEDHLSHLDYAVLETTHIEPERIIQHARTSSVKEYVLTHLGDDHAVNALQDRISAAGLRNIHLASDGMRLQL